MGKRRVRSIIVLLVSFSLLSLVATGCGSPRPSCPFAQKSNETDLRIVAYGGETYVIGDGYGTMYTSPDGVNWKRSAEMRTKPVDMLFADGKFVVATVCDIALISRDGTKWSVVTQDHVPYGPLVHARGKYVSPGGGGKVVHSPDGITWQSYPVPDPVGGTAIAYGAGKYVLAGIDGKVWSSLDGQTWTRHKTGLLERFNYVTFGNGIFVAVGDHGTITTSVDGATWQQQTSGTDQDLLGVTEGNGLFVAVGTGGTLLTSRNGVRWERTWTPPQGHDLWLWRATYGGGKWIVVGVERTILRSEDGTTWHQDKLPYK